MKHRAVSSRIFFNIAPGVPSIPDALLVFKLFTVPTVSFNEGFSFVIRKSGLEHRLLHFALVGLTIEQFAEMSTHLFNC